MNLWLHLIGNNCLNQNIYESNSKCEESSKCMYEKYYSFLQENNIIQWFLKNFGVIVERFKKYNKTESLNRLSQNYQNFG